MAAGGRLGVALFALPSLGLGLAGRPNAKAAAVAAFREGEVAREPASRWRGPQKKPMFMGRFAFRCLPRGMVTKGWQYDRLGARRGAP